MKNWVGGPKTQTQTQTQTLFPLFSTLFFPFPFCLFFLSEWHQRREGRGFNKLNEGKTNEESKKLWTSHDQWPPPLFASSSSSSSSLFVHSLSHLSVHILILCLCLCLCLCVYAQLLFFLRLSMSPHWCVSMTFIPCLAQSLFYRYLYSTTNTTWITSILSRPITNPRNPGLVLRCVTLLPPL